MDDKEIDKFCDTFVETVKQQNSVIKILSGVIAAIVLVITSAIVLVLLLI